jgi:branched-chain amino acid aminotransferase
MINFNGKYRTKTVLTQNRAFLWRCRFETVKNCKFGKILFLEDHYFRLMAPCVYKVKWKSHDLME